MAAFGNNELINYMEYFVQEAMDQVLPGMNICMCDNCLADIAALTLNELPPKYVVTRKGHLYTKLKIFEQQFGVDITTEVMKSAKHISENPRHDTEVKEIEKSVKRKKATTAKPAKSAKETKK